jgi:hypothetical protein
LQAIDRSGDDRVQVDHNPRGEHDRDELRYWNGQRWTEHVSERETQAVDPM